MKKIIFTAIALAAVLIAGTTATFAAGNGQRNNALKNENSYCVNNGECVRTPEACPNMGECPNNGERPLDGTGYRRGNVEGKGGKGCKRNR